MWKLLVVLGFMLVAWVTVVEARCVTHTITTADGRMVVCQTCCYGNSCNTTCF